jgi:hypothetical protein
MSQGGWLRLFERDEGTSEVKLDYNLQGAQRFQINTDIPSIRLVHLNEIYFLLLWFKTPKYKLNGFEFRIGKVITRRLLLPIETFVIIFFLCKLFSFPSSTPA